MVHTYPLAFLNTSPLLRPSPHFSYYLVATSINSLNPPNSLTLLISQPTFNPHSFSPSPFHTHHLTWITSYYIPFTPSCYSSSDIHHPLSPCSLLSPSPSSLRPFNSLSLHTIMVLTPSASHTDPSFYLMTPITPIPPPFISNTSVVP